MTLRQLGLRPGERFVYEYDMGDMWVHELRLERVVPADARMRYPQCIGGKRAGSPEHCGGPWACMELRDELVLHSGSNDWSDWDEFVDDDEDERPDRLYPGFDPERFARKDVNGELMRWFAPSGSQHTGGDQRCSSAFASHTSSTGSTSRCASPSCARWQRGCQTTAS